MSYHIAIDFFLKSGFEFLSVFDFTIFWDIFSCSKLKVPSNKKKLGKSKNIPFGSKTLLKLKVFNKDGVGPNFKKSFGAGKGKLRGVQGGKIVKNKNRKGKR